MSDPQYEIVVHRSAENELAGVTGDAGDELTSRLKQLTYHEQPTECAYVKQLSDHGDLFRVRIEDYRAICRLDKPEIQVLAVDTRSRAYDKIETAKRRAGLAD